jgi:hypothetical protein
MKLLTGDERRVNGRITERKITAMKVLQDPSALVYYQAPGK